MDTLLLSRVQFGFTIGFHILFPTLTIGLAWLLVFFEAAHARTHKAHWLALYRLWVKVFALTFGVGVVSGLVLSYEIGTNFSRFSAVAGPVIGPLLSAEVLTAFFVEAGFLGIMLFGWDKVGPRLHFIATLLVAVGTTNSAFWILAANSFMHTPAGTRWDHGLLVPQDWLAVIFNPSFPYRLAHMLLAALVTASLVVSGVSAWYVRTRRHGEVGLSGLKAGLTLLAIVAPLQILAGDLHGLEVRRTQPAKLAAIEGLWRSATGAPLVLFALPDQDAQENHAVLEVPHLGSLILAHEWNGAVRGMNEFPRGDQPPVLPVFFAFRAMVGLGLWFVLLGAWGTLRRLQQRLADSTWLLRALNLSIPLGFVATISGWLVAEIGRQPWVVYGMIRTADAVSPVPAPVVGASLLLFALAYSMLLGAWIYFTFKLLQKGPPPPPAAFPEAMRGARAAQVIGDAGEDDAYPAHAASPAPDAERR